MRDFSYEEINNMSEESVKQILRDEMLDRANKRVEEERRKEEAKEERKETKREIPLISSLAKRENQDY